MKDKLKWTEYITLFLLTFIIALVIIYWQPITKLFSEKENIQNFISNFGILAPLGFILIQIFQIIIAPIPAFATLGYFWLYLWLVLGKYLQSFGTDFWFCYSFLFGEDIWTSFGFKINS